MEMCDDRDEGTGFYEGRTSTNEAKSTGPLWSETK